MNLGDKLRTLLSARLRSASPLKGKRRHPPPADPGDQLAAIRQALAEVEAKEQAVADQLRATEATATEAAAKGNREAEREQQRLANELKAHLETQSTQAIKLQEKLAALEEKLAQTRQEAQQRLAVSSTTVGETSQSGSAPGVTAETGDDEDADLTARKSRLSS